MTKANCAACGTTYGNLAGHTLATEVWGYIDPSGHAHMCAVQDCYYHGTLEPHRSGGPATETEDEVCLDCGYVITLAVAHEHKALDGYHTDAESHWQICGCGLTMNKASHADADGDRECDTCGIAIAGPGDASEPTGTVPQDPGDDPTVPAEPQTPDRNGDAFWIAVIVLIVLATGIGAAWILLKKDQKDKADPEDTE
ncbi:MAG: hypothetical protein E7436_01015 [Ruminococcaceae bacterium]|nr:hypothetical protein [Oscillospiraceae bacterium]